MGFSDIDKKANGAGGGKPVTLSKEQEERLARLPEKLRARARAKMLESAARGHGDKNGGPSAGSSGARGGSGAGGSGGDLVPSGSAAAGSGRRDGGADGERGHAHTAGGHHVHVTVAPGPGPVTSATVAPVVVQPKPLPPPLWEIANRLTVAVLLLVAGAALWALFGRLIMMKLGG